MTKRVVLVPADADILSDASTEILHTYNNGSVLVRTDAASAEDRASGEIPVASGVRLARGTADDLTRARNGLNVALRPLPEAALMAARIHLDAPATPIPAYIALIGPVAPVWLDRLRELGIEPLRYHPENTFLCRGTLPALRQAKQQAFVIDVIPINAALKPALDIIEEAGSDVWVLIDDVDEQGTTLLPYLRALAGVDIAEQPIIERVDFMLRIRARVNALGQQALLNQPHVLGIEVFVPPAEEDEAAGLILASAYDLQGRPAGSYLTWLEDHGLTGEGVTIGIVDKGVDVSHHAFQDRVRDLTGGLRSWHGTFVAGHAAGNYLQERDRNQLIYGLGTAPAANLLIQDNQRTASELCAQTVSELAPNNLPGLVQNNSWGKGLSNPMDYGSEEALYDRLVRNATGDPQTPKPLTICFSSGNSGTGGLTRPKAAKNIIVTGNSEAFRPDVGHDQSDNIREVYTGPNASSHGNCGDMMGANRIRPHLVAPGEWTASANYDSHEGEKEFISPKLTWGGGSSGASPKTAGACALLIQWWRRHNNGQDPSPALLRALLVNGAESIDTGGRPPNKIQGWGRLNVANIINDTIPHLYVDQSILLKEVGEEREWRLRTVDANQPIKITLAWTDPPGNIGTGGSSHISTLVNCLALSAESNGVRYRGNTFANGWSVPDDRAVQDGLDNLQNIFLAPGIASTLRITVRALNITTNCLTGKLDIPQQDFALVITNGQLEAGSTPATVFVAVDRNAAGQPKGKPDDYWNDTVSAGDHQELSRDWWQNEDQAADTQPTVQPGANGVPSATQAAEDDWWSQPDIHWSQPETEQSHAPLSTQSVFARSICAGLDIIGGMGQQAVRAQTQATTEAGAAVELVALGQQAEGEYTQTATEVVQALEGELTPALARLMAGWKQLAADQRQVAVIVVGAGTRCTHADLAALRQVAFIGELYLLSTDPGILTFLAQRLYCRSGLHFRLAHDDEELATLARDTLAEAVGAHIVAVQSPAQVTTDAIFTRHQFAVVAADRHLTMRLRYGHDTLLRQVKLTRPGQPAVDLTTNQPEGMTIRRQEGLLQLDIAAPAAQEAWHGSWLLEVEQPSGLAEQAAVMTVWARGGPTLAVHTGTAAEAETQRDGEIMVMVAADNGAQLAQAMVTPRHITVGDTVNAEADQEIVLRLTRSRRARQMNAMEAGKANGIRPASEAAQDHELTATLSKWLRLPASNGAAVVDLPVRVSGKDEQGFPFFRALRANLVRLQPRSIWRKQMANPQILFTAGYLSEIEQSNGEIVALRIRRGAQQRRVWITSPLLRRQLAEIDLTAFHGEQLHFGVTGNEMVALLRVFGGEGTLPISPLLVNGGERYAIEQPIPEPQTPYSEAGTTDYPLASRFIPAKWYRTTPGTRTIERVVIHITDGRERIDGPISWFKNPVKADGTPVKVSAHYIVGQDGEVVQMVRDNDVAYHAGSANGDSIGIEHCARTPGAFGRTDTGLYPSAIQYAASAALVRWLCEQYRIPMTRDYILGHAEADANTTHLGCPNSVWNWDYFMKMVTLGMSLPPF